MGLQEAGLSILFQRPLGSDVIAEAFEKRTFLAAARRELDE